MTSASTTPDNTNVVSPTTESLKFSDRLVQAGVGLTKLAQSPSANSLNNVLSVLSDSSNHEQNFRICQYCQNLLDARERLKARHYNKPIVHQLYEKLSEYMTKAQRRIDQYDNMWRSLREGESTYNLRDAQILRAEIAKIGDQIDLISKKIAILVTIDDNSSATLKQEFQLNQMVRTTAMIFLKNKLLRIPPVPSEDEFNNLKKQRQERIMARIEYEKLLEADHDQNGRTKDFSPDNQIAMLSPTSGQVKKNMMNQKSYFPNLFHFFVFPTIEISFTV